MTEYRTTIEKDGYVAVTFDGRTFSTKQVEDLQAELEKTRAERDELAAVVREVLSNFTETGHPGEPCRRTGWVSESLVTYWHAVVGGIR